MAVSWSVILRTDRARASESFGSCVSICASNVLRTANRSGASFPDASATANYNRNKAPNRRISGASGRARIGGAAMSPAWQQDMKGHEDGRQARHVTRKAREALGSDPWALLEASNGTVRTPRARVWHGSPVAAMTTYRGALLRIGFQRARPPPRLALSVLTLWAFS